MSAAGGPLGQATYVASGDDGLWLQIAQRKLYERSRANPDYVFEKLWGLITDPRNLRIALARVHRNRGARTAGIDRITVRHVLLDGAEPFLAELRKELRGGTFRPMPVRRVLIPKAGKPGKFRPLGIPTVKDRVVQAAVKNILEPIFEADFYPVSHGFRPGKSVHGAIAHLKALMLPRSGKIWRRENKLPFQWAIEGDIKGCFDNIGHPSHGGLVAHAVIPKEQSKRLRQKIKDIFRRSTCGESLDNRLRLINPVIRGWANFYRHAWGAKRVFAANDHYVWWAIYRWLRKKHPKTRMRDIYARYGWRKPRGRTIRWRDGVTDRVTMSPTRVRPFCLSWQKAPAFAPSLWRARCVTKGARRVRRGAAGNSLRRRRASAGCPLYTTGPANREETPRSMHRSRLSAVYRDTPNPIRRMRTMQRGRSDVSGGKA